MGFPGSSTMKNLPTVQEPQEMQVTALCQGDSLVNVFLEDRSSSQKEIFFYSLGASIPNSPWQTDIQTHGKNSRFFRRKEG